MRSMDELPCYNEEASSCSIENEDELEDFKEFDEVGNSEPQKKLLGDDLASRENSNGEIHSSSSKLSEEIHGENCNFSEDSSVSATEVDKKKEPEQLLYIASPEFEILDLDSYRETEEANKVPDKDNEEAAVPGEIEIIDLLSPSPCCRSNATTTHGKRRKVSSFDHQEIIDLTRSPMFVQL